MKLKISFALLITCVVSVATAEKLDIHTHDLVINRLEETLPTVKGQDSEPRVLIRLADLYADRARLIAIKNEQTKCTTDCESEAKDRKKAIAAYQKAFASANLDQKSHILLQSAHLHLLTGDIDQAKKVYLDIIKNKKVYSAALVGDAFAGLAEIQYRNGEFKLALGNFKNALEYPIKNKNFVMYRLAWCHLNEGDGRKAKLLVLDILGSQKALEPSFKKDLTRDLATFIARDEVSDKTIQELLKYTASENRKDNLFYLGKECDRLGNRHGAILVWRTYAAMNDVNSDESLEILVRTAQNMLDQGHAEESLTYYAKYFEKLDKNGCEDKRICDELAAKSRSYVHGWIKKEKTAPTQQLLRALTIYAANNAEDVEMVNWAGHVARQLQNNVKASQFYRLAAEQSYKNLKYSKFEFATKEITQRTFEGALLAEIECAEESHNIKERELAYNHYLALNPKGEKRSEVLYQIARLKYEKGEYFAAARDFRELAESNKLEKSFRVQSADLALDCYSILKDAESIEKYALKYATLFAEKRNEYSSIARKASVNLAISKFGGGRGSPADLDIAKEKIESVTLVGATHDEKINIYKNRILIAEKMRDLEAVDRASADILNLKPLSQADEEFALNKRLAVAEIRLDFKAAAGFAKSSRLEQLSKEDRLLKLAFLTELSGRNSSQYYSNYLSQASNIKKSNIVRAKLIRESSKPWQTLGKFRQQLRKSPDIYAQLLAETFGRDRNFIALNKYINDREIRRTPQVANLKMHLAIEQDGKFDTEIKRHRINSRTNSKLQATLKKRMQLLKTADQIANVQLRKGEFLMQIITLSRVSRENLRMYNDILSLPAPRGLKPQEKAQYQKLIMAQAAPYKIKSDNVKAKISAIWDTSRALTRLLEIAENEPGDIRKLAIYELKLLSKYAPQDNKGVIVAAIQSAPKTAKSKEVEEARQAVRNDPFDLEKIEYLKNLELLRGKLTMVGFLEARMSAVKAGRF
jgi:hypothetical protein